MAKFIVLSTRSRKNVVEEQKLVACVPSFINKSVDIQTRLKKRFVHRSTAEILRDQPVTIISY